MRFFSFYHVVVCIEVNIAGMSDATHVNVVHFIDKTM